MPTNQTAAPQPLIVEIAPKTVYRKDYTPSAFLLEETHLNFHLEAAATRVTSTLKVRRNGAVPVQKNLELSGEDLTFISAKLNGTPLTPQEYALQSNTLAIFNVPDVFTLEIEVETNPTANTTLMGLYKDSGGMLCTQCEAEGFRRITYYLDRPDVLSIFTVRLEGDKKAYPILLSNGNKIEEGQTTQGRHYAVWHDPFPKASYLFALVAGDLQHLEDSFITMSGHKVTLKLFTEAHNMHKTAYAMDALKRSMRWDEEKFGREYDLDIFMIVAVDAFNMGAMENKGLNIFNASTVLASVDTATDAQFMYIERVVGHEYFHNWSGNRVTCRSWFELSLKEGFTVFRDAAFSADMNDPAVKRIQDVTTLRAVQFREDAGPMAHPIRPDSYQSIDNFYTTTVYNKGAEVIGMCRTILGKENFRKGCDLYFDRHDGQAVTCEDFTKAMEDASGTCLKTFRNWYSQEGTPVLNAHGTFNPAENTYTLKFKQNIKPQQQAFHIPIKMGLLGQNGAALPLCSSHSNFSQHASDQCVGVFHLKTVEDTVVFTGVSTQPVPSLLQGFSAPVRLNFPYTDAELMLLISHDTDGFNRWESGQTLAVRTALGHVAAQTTAQAAHASLKETPQEALLLKTIGNTLKSALCGDLSPALATEALTLPNQSYLVELQPQTDLEATQTAYEHLRARIAQTFESTFKEVYTAFSHTEAYAPTAQQIGKRSLKNLALHYLMHTGNRAHIALATRQFEEATNMTDALSALAALVTSPHTEAAKPLLEAFYKKWQHDALVLDSWFSLQCSNQKEGTFAQIKTLTAHEKFTFKRPNTMRATLGAFTASGVRNFHHISGEGYAWFTDNILKLDSLNPQVAARLITPLINFKRYTQPRQQLMRQQLERALAHKGLSANMAEVVSKALS